MQSGTAQTSETVLANRSGTRTVCRGCGKKGPGVWPLGWLVVPVWGRVGDRAAVVGEWPYCPDCRRAGRVQYPTGA